MSDTELSSESGERPGEQAGEQPGGSAGGSAGPPLRLVRGDATPEEVAALLAVLSAASGGDSHVPGTRHTSLWSSPARAVRRPHTPGPGAWRASAWR